MNAKHYLKLIKNHFSQFVEKQRICQIRGIRNATVYISYFGIDTFLKVKLEDIIFDSELISRLPIEQLPKLGYEYGKCYLVNKGAFKSLNQLAIVDDNNCLYNIISIKRNKEVTYINRGTSKVMSHAPGYILENKSLILRFSRSQILYIGFYTAYADHLEARKNMLMKLK